MPALPLATSSRPVRVMEATVEEVSAIHQYAWGRATGSRGASLSVRTSDGQRIDRWACAMTPGRARRSKAVPGRSRRRSGRAKNKATPDNETAALPEEAAAASFKRYCIEIVTPPRLRLALEADLDGAYVEDYAPFVLQPRGVSAAPPIGGDAGADRRIGAGDVGRLPEVAGNALHVRRGSADGADPDAADAERVGCLPRSAVDPEPPPTPMMKARRCRPRSARRRLCRIGRCGRAAQHDRAGNHRQRRFWRRERYQNMVSSATFLFEWMIDQPAG